MMSEETTTIAVCAVSVTALERVVGVIQDAGKWSVVPMHWPDASGLIQAHHLAHVFVLCSDSLGSDAEELVRVLNARPATTPLIVTGSDPASGARPNVWLPSLPGAVMISRILHQLIDDQPAVASTSQAWRRKSDIIIGNSLAIRQLLHTLDQLAPSSTPVLITGESGVGKELVARALHFGGPRAKQPFIAINCAAIPENLIEGELFGHQRGAFTGAVSSRVGAIEAADHGTLFLDEIGEMPFAMQAKLLRVLETSVVQPVGSVESRKVNFRLVTATNRNLGEEITRGRFREDLYYRIQVYPLEVPPLRDRPEDVPLLVTHHLSVIAIRDRRVPLRLTPAALEKVLVYGWPGNVRELVNVLERAVLLAGDRVIDEEHVLTSPGPPGLPASSGKVLPYRTAKAKFERDYYSQLLQIVGGNISLAAKLGKKTRKEIYDAVKRLKLEVTTYRDGS